MATADDAEATVRVRSSQRSVTSVNDIGGRTPAERPSDPSPWDAGAEPRAGSTLYYLFPAVGETNE